MSTQEQIGRLQGLLARIQRNASRPQTATPLAAPAAFAPLPPFQAAPPPPGFEARASSYADQATETSFEASPAVESPSDVDDGFSAEEVSEVRFATAPRAAGPEVTVAAIEAEAEPLGSDELSDDDLVEVTEGSPAPPPVDVDVDFDFDDEEPPASSRRSKVAASMDEALTAAAEEAEREAPLQTPPPESGPQAATAPLGLSAPSAASGGALLGEELDIPTRGDSHLTSPSLPTAEQLGQTIDLDEARGPSLELAEHQVDDAPAAALVEELEVALPARDLVAGYDDSLLPPPEALSDLAAHRRSLEDDIAPPPESLAQLPSARPGRIGAEIVPIQTSYQAPEVIARLVTPGSPATFNSIRQTFHPNSFVELLDASLSLSGE